MIVLRSFVVIALFGIITAINEHIIGMVPPRIYTGPAEPSSLPCPLCISALKDLETLVEVATLGNEKKWNFISNMEATN